MKIKQNTDAVQILVTINELGYEIDVFDGTPLTKQTIENVEHAVMAECRDCEEEIDVIDLAVQIKKELRNETTEGGEV